MALHGLHYLNLMESLPESSIMASITCLRFLMKKSTEGNGIYMILVLFLSLFFHIGVCIVSVLLSYNLSI